MSDEATTHNPELNPSIGIVMTVFFLIWTGMIAWFTEPGQQVWHLIWFRF